MIFREHPRDPQAPNRFLCTPEHPMPKGAKGLWSHKKVQHVGVCYEGCCDDYECRSCGTTWRRENPE
jgi:hypothetical protein